MATLSSHLNVFGVMVMRNKVLEWVACFLNCVGALVLAMQFQTIGYTLFLIGSIIWLYLSQPGGNRAMWFFFLGCNGLGLYNAIN